MFYFPKMHKPLRRHLANPPRLAERSNLDPKIRPIEEVWLKQYQLVN
jgi:hypothetical protein